MTMAGRAEAGGPKWIAAGDMDGALGACDPAMFAQTSNQGATWSTGEAFRAVAVPCGRGGRINEVIGTPSGRMFAAGYRYAANGHKQGVLMYSDDGRTWPVAREIPVSNSDTEYLDVAYREESGQAKIGLWSGDITTSGMLNAAGPYTSGWMPFAWGGYGSGYTLTDIERNDSHTWTLVGHRTIGGRECGIHAMQGSTTSLRDQPTLNTCVSNRDVEFNGVHVENGNQGQTTVMVGSASGSGVPTQAVVRVWGNTSPAPIVLPGNGMLHDVVSDGSGTWVAVGERTIFGFTVGVVYRSTDRGVTWTLASLPQQGATPLHSVTWQAPNFVAVGDSGNVVVSPDGVTWTATGSPNASSTLRSIAGVN